MAISTLVVVLTHTGLTKEGKANPSSLFIPDIEVGYEYQTRKQAVYVPRYQAGTTNAGTLELAVTNRVAFSLMSGAIKSFVDDGLLACNTYVRTGSTLSAFPSLGSGAFTIADGGNLEATYNGSVVCLDQASVTSDVVVNGNLLVIGTLSNLDHFDVMVRGDLIVNDLDFDPDEDVDSACELEVEGDFIFRSATFRNRGSFTSSLRVRGDMTGADYDDEKDFYGNGYPGARGLDVTVNGSMSVGYMNIDGGSIDEGNGGNAGSLYVGGSASISDYSADGGDSYDTGNGGNGGFVQIVGSFVATSDFSAIGGDSVDGVAGQGGSFNVGRDASVSDLDVYGGDCSGDNSTGVAGSGGYVDVDGNLTVQNDIETSGGTRGGVIPVAVDLTPANAGDISVDGNFMADDVFLHGGHVYASGNKVCNAGNGGTLNVDGASAIYDSLDLYGGECSIGNGGNGGSIYAYSGLSADYVEIHGGGSNASGNGGNGGYMNVENHFSGGIYGSGGFVYGGNGGIGATIHLDCSVHISDYLDDEINVFGGWCYSTDGDHVAGAGGSVYIDGDVVGDASIVASAGGRTGSPVLDNNNGTSVNGGNIIIRGSATLNGIYSVGSTVSTDKLNCVGGNGGIVSVQGNATISNEINVSGGSSFGNNGGNGGSITISGFATVDEIFTSGGSSNLYGSRQGTGGTCGNITLRSASVIERVIMEEGGGTSVSGDYYLYLSGHSAIQYTNISDTARAHISTIDSNEPVTLQIGEMNGKVTLNENSGAATQVVSGMCNDSIFKHGNGIWYRLQGTSLVD